MPDRRRGGAASQAAVLPRRHNILDNITLYWLTGTGASTARSYWEAYGAEAPAAGNPPLPPPAIPFGFTSFPGEILRTPRSWVEASYPNITYFNAVEKGVHFAAWEEPGNVEVDREGRNRGERAEENDQPAALRLVLAPGINAADHASASPGTPDSRVVLRRNAESSFLLGEDSP